MRKPRHITRAFALAAAGALVLAGCSAVDETAPTGNGTAAEDGADSSDIQIGDGVTEEPCPARVNPDNGCIYLGILSDLTEGPFSALATHIVQAQRDYWTRANEAGGINGFDVDVDTYTRDTKYQPAEHAQAYQQIESNILALAQSLGTVNTEAILGDMDASDIVAVPASWWSGYAFEENDNGLILEHGISYCVESVVGLDWFAENKAEGDVTSVAAVGYPGDYGGDSAEGVKLWAEANDVTDVTVVPTGPNQVTGNQDAVVSAVSSADPDVVVLATGPAETAEIIGKLAAGGYQGHFMGSVPTWNPALLQTAAAPALKAMYNHMAPGEQWDGDSQAIVDMRDALGGEPPVNGGYIIGWIMNYPMHAALQAAADNGDLTRAGLRAAVDGLTVDFDGASPEVTYGAAADSLTRELIIFEADEEADLGTSAVSDFYGGTTMDQVDITSACSGSS